MKNPMRAGRPRIQRAFFRWLEAHQRRFAVPLRIIKRTDRYVEMAFVGVNPLLSVTLTSEIGVHVNWHGEWWDALMFFEACPTRSPQGYICETCLPEAQIFFPSREALWEDHMFQPFLEWVNNKLVSARWIGVFQTETNGGRWADLLAERQPEEPAQAWLPVWLANTE